MPLASLQRKPGRRKPLGQHLGYLENRFLFEEFQALQEAFVLRLAAHPDLIRGWASVPPPKDEAEQPEPPAKSRTWRGTHLTAERQRKLSLLLADAEGPAKALEPLATFLLKSLAVRVYFAIADRATPGLSQTDPETAELYRRLEAKRDQLFHANIGLAKAAVRGRRLYDEYLSVASEGVLDAIDRYDVHDRASFAYFAHKYWIRHHINRYSQKNNTTVALSINQQRIVNRIERYLDDRRNSGLPEPTEEEICAALKITPDAYYWFLKRPSMVSLDDKSQAEDDTGEPAPDLENVIASEEPKPNEEVEDTEIAAYLQEILRANIPAYRRVMMAYHRNTGNLGDAVEDYLGDLQREAVLNLNRSAAVLKDSSSPAGSLRFLPNFEDPPTG